MYTSFQHTTVDGKLAFDPCCFPRSHEFLSLLYIWSALAMQEYTGKGDIEKERKEIRDVRNSHPSVANLHTFAPSAAVLTIWNRARPNASQVSCCNMCVLLWACRCRWDVKLSD